MKRLTNNLSLLVVICSLLFVLSSCGADDPIPLTPERGGEVLTGDFIAGSGDNTLTFTFRDDNTVLYAVKTITDTQKLEGAYYLDGEELTIKNADNEEIKCKYNRGDGTITLSSENSDLEDTILTREVK